jgi:hypothetical protein
MLRQFAAGWFLFFLAVAAWHGLHRGQTKLGLALAALAIVGGVLGLVRPSALRWAFCGWMMLAFPIGWLMSHVVLLILFYGAFTPVALFFRWRGRDPLHLRRPANAEASLWHRKNMPVDMKSYFRQY